MSRTCAPAARELLDRAAPGADFTLLIEARDFLRVHLPRLTPRQRDVVEAWAGGRTCREIAAASRVSEQAVHKLLAAGLRRLRELGE